MEAPVFRDEMKLINALSHQCEVSFNNLAKYKNKLFATTKHIHYVNLAN